MSWKWLFVSLFPILSSGLAAQSAGTVQFSQAAYTINEDDGFATITLTRTGGSNGEASVQVLINDGSANASADYTLVPSCVGPPCPPITWADGDATPHTFLIRIVDDLSDEPDETLLMTLTDPQGVTIGTPNNAVLTILDNDEAAIPTIGDSTQLLLIGLLAAAGSWLILRSQAT